MRRENARSRVEEGRGGGRLPVAIGRRRSGCALYALRCNVLLLAYAGLVSVRRNGQQMIYAAAYDGMQRLMGFLTENCCQLDARGCSSDCPQSLLTRKKQKRTRQKVQAA